MVDNQFFGHGKGFPPPYSGTFSSLESCQSHLVVADSNIFSNSMSPPRSLIFDVLASLPTKRQAYQFLSKKKRTLIIMQEPFSIHQQISEFQRVNLNPIVLLQTNERDFHTKMRKCYKFMEKIPNSFAIQDLKQPSLLREISTASESGKVPVLISACIENNIVQHTSWKTSIKLLLEELMAETGTRTKVIVYREAGGLMVEQEPRPFHCFSSSSQISLPIEARMIKYALEILPLSASGLLISPYQTNIMSMMVTEKVAGIVSSTANPPTVFRRGVGVKIYKSHEFDQLDKQNLTELLESSFGKKLEDDYYDKIRNQVFMVAIAGDFDGAIIVTKPIGDYLYLDKFAIAPSSQGIGVSDILWGLLMKNEIFYWRSRYDNPVNKWYYDKCDGHLRQGNWIIFWHGIQQVSTIQELCTKASEIDPSFKSSST